MRYSLAFLSLVTTASAQTLVNLELNPVSDAVVRNNAIDARLLDDPTEDDLFIFQSGSLTQNGIYEFALSSIPANATVLSATFELTVISNVSNVGSTPAPIELYDFTGDGTVTTADWDAGDGQQVTPTLSVPLNTSIGSTLSFAIADLTGIDDARSSSNQFYGLRTETNNFATIRTASSENTQNPVPKLTVTYSTPVPEPSSALLGIMALGIAANRRRRK